MKEKSILFMILALVLTVGIVGCSQTEDTHQGEPSQEQVYTEELTLNEDQEAYIIQTLNDMVLATALEGANFIVSLEENTLKIDVIKPILEVMEGYNTMTADDTVAAFRRSLTLDTAYEIITTELTIATDRAQVYLFDSEENQEQNEWYTLKTIINK